MSPISISVDWLEFDVWTDESTSERASALLPISILCSSLKVSRNEFWLFCCDNCQANMKLESDEKNLCTAMFTCEKRRRRLRKGLISSWEPFLVCLRLRQLSKVATVLAHSTRLRCETRCHINYEEKSTLWVCRLIDKISDFATFRLLCPIIRGRKLFASCQTISNPQIQCQRRSITKSNALSLCLRWNWK